MSAGGCEDLAEDAEVEARDQQAWSDIFRTSSVTDTSKPRRAGARFGLQYVRSMCCALVGALQAVAVAVAASAPGWLRAVPACMPRSVRTGPPPETISSGRVSEIPPAP